MMKAKKSSSEIDEIEKAKKCSPFFLEEEHFSLNGEAFTGDAVSPDELKTRFDASSAPQCLLRRRTWKLWKLWKHWTLQRKSSIFFQLLWSLSLCCNMFSELHVMRKGWYKGLAFQLSIYALLGATLWGISELRTKESQVFYFEKIWNPKIISLGFAFRFQERPSPCGARVLWGRGFLLARRRNQHLRYLRCHQIDRQRVPILWELERGAPFDAEKFDEFFRMVSAVHEAIC